MKYSIDKALISVIAAKFKTDARRDIGVANLDLLKDAELPERFTCRLPSLTSTLARSWIYFSDSKEVSMLMQFCIQRQKVPRRKFTEEEIKFLKTVGIHVMT
jgi:hypothetical protein